MDEVFIAFDTVANLGHEIRRLRRRAGLTQGALAEKAGVSRRWVSSAERGHVGGEIGNLMKVVRALEVKFQFMRPQVSAL